MRGSSDLRRSFSSSHSEGGAYHFINVLRHVFNKRKKNFEFDFTGALTLNNCNRHYIHHHQSLFILMHFKAVQFTFKWLDSQMFLSDMMHIRCTHMHRHHTAESTDTEPPVLFASNCSLTVKCTQDCVKKHKIKKT